MAQYSVLQYHSVSYRGESVNIAVVVWSPEAPEVQYWKVSEDFARVLRLWPLERADWLGRRVGQIIDQIRENPKYLTEQVPQHYMSSGAFVLRAPHGSLAGSLVGDKTYTFEAAVNGLFKTFVEEP